MYILQTSTANQPLWHHCPSQLHHQQSPFPSFHALMKNEHVSVVHWWKMDMQLSCTDEKWKCICHALMKNEHVSVVHWWKWTCIYCALMKNEHASGMRWWKMNMYLSCTNEKWTHICHALTKIGHISASFWGYVVTNHGRGELGQQASTVTVWSVYNAIDRNAAQCNPDAMKLQWNTEHMEASTSCLCNISINLLFSVKTLYLYFCGTNTSFVHL